MPPPASPLLDLHHLHCAYDGTPILTDVSLRLAEGAFVGVVGPSGSGKTTLLRALLGAVPHIEGGVTVMGRPVRPGSPPPNVGYVPQVETVDWTFPVTVAEVVGMGLSMRGGWLPWPGREDRGRVDAVLDRLGLGGFRRRHVGELSGGQQQRVFLARALVSWPRLLLLDEPTSGVDIKTRDDVLHLLLDLNRHEGVSIILTTHELNGVAAHLPEVVAVNRTVVAHGPPARVFTRPTLRAVYGADLTVVHQDGMVIVADAPHGFRAALGGLAAGAAGGG